MGSCKIVFLQITACFLADVTAVEFSMLQQPQGKRIPAAHILADRRARPEKSGIPVLHEFSGLPCFFKFGIKINAVWVIFPFLQIFIDFPPCVAAFFRPVFIAAEIAVDQAIPTAEFRL